MSKKSKIKRKSKRREWWNTLDENGKARCVNYWLSKKAEKRRNKQINIMKHRKPEDCKKCIHGVTESCTDNLERGCEYFYKVA